MKLGAYVVFIAYVVYFLPLMFVCRNFMFFNSFRGLYLSPDLKFLVRFFLEFPSVFHLRSRRMHLTSYH